MNPKTFRFSTEKFKEWKRDYYIILALFNSFNLFVFSIWWILAKDVSDCTKPIVGSILLLLGCGGSTVLFVYMMESPKSRNFSILVTEEKITLKKEKRPLKNLFLKDIQKVLIDMNKSGKVRNIALKTTDETLNIKGYYHDIDLLLEHIQAHLRAGSAVQRKTSSLFSPTAAERNRSHHKAANKRDAPGLCIIFGVLAGLLAITLLYAGRLNITDRSNLRVVSGRVEGFSRTTRSKTGRKIHLYVRDEDRIHHLTQDNLTWAVPKLRDLRVGDEISALVKPDFMCADLEWLWEIRRGNENILTYEETLHYFQRQTERMRPAGHAAAGAALFLLATGGLLRLYFGTWFSVK